VSKDDVKVVVTEDGVDWEALFGEKDAAVGREVSNTIRNVIAGNWPLIRKAAEQAMDGPKMTVGLSVKIDFDDPPSGKVDISFATRIKDSAEFHVEDKKQGKLPLEGGEDPNQWGPGTGEQ